MFLFGGKRSPFLHRILWILVFEEEGESVELCDLFVCVIYTVLEVVFKKR